MLVMELTFVIDVAGTLQTFYFGDEGYTTLSTDTPPKTSILDRLLNPGSLGIHTYSDGRTGGVTKLEMGQIKIANADGLYDAWRTYSVDGQPAIMRSGTLGDPYPASFTTIMSATMEDLDMDWNTIEIRLRDKTFIFDKPVITTKYAGNNSLPNGLEGNATDIKGKNKPRTIGKVFNVAPPLVNTSKYTYQVNNGTVSDIPAVYDGGLLLTKGLDYANSTLLHAAAPAVSTYITCFAEGLFRLGSIPAQQITADVIQGANVAARTVAQILKQLALDAGLLIGNISSADVTALDTANSAVVGVYIDDDSNFISIMDKVVNSIGGWYGFDGPGVLRMGRLTAPTGTPVATLYDYDFGENIERVIARENGLPVWSVKVNHTLIWVVQTSGLNGAATVLQRAYLSQAFRTEVVENATIKTQYSLAKTLSVDTLLTSAADALTEATRLLAMYQTRRDMFQVPLDIHTFSDYNLKLMDVISIHVNRFGMDNGRLFIILGINIDVDINVVTISVWG